MLRRCLVLGVFYVMTGFHGAHVGIGSVFLGVSLSRIVRLNGHFLVLDFRLDFLGFQVRLKWGSMLECELMRESRVASEDLGFRCRVSDGELAGGFLIWRS